MPTRSVRYKKQLDAGSPGKEPVPIEDGIRRVLEMAKVQPGKGYKGARKRKGFDQTIDLVMNLGIDPKQADQMLRGSVSLPKGIGQAKKVIAFCEGELAETAKAAGAMEVGSDELIKKIQDGWSDFDIAIAHPSMMGKVGKLGRVLGPQGKMPSPKEGTVTQDVETAVREFGAGKLSYRNDAGGNVHAIVGKASFSPDDLKTNIEAFVDHVKKIKPSAAKGTYIKRVCLSGTMTPSVTLSIG